MRFPAFVDTELPYSGAVQAASQVDHAPSHGERVGVRVSAHVLRHTCGSLLYLEEGWNDKEVQHALGHHKASFTLDTYIHLLPREEPRTPSFLHRQGANQVGTRHAETPQESLAAVEAETA